MPSHSHKTKVVFSVTNCICFDQRVLKIAETVRSLDCDVTIIGRKRGACCESDSVPFKTKRFRMFFKMGFLFYKFFNIRLFIYLLFHKYDLHVANDLDTLLPNYLVSKLKNISLVYDSHEYFTGVPELNGRPIVKWVWTVIERSIFPHLKNVMTVSEPIASLYEKMYKVKALVVKNVSRNANDIIPYSRTELGIPKDDLLIILQGTGINIDKGAEELIEAVNMSAGVSLLIVGSGDVVPFLKQQVIAMKIESRVKFISSVSWNELMRYSKAADVGVCLEKDTNINYRFSLPNKLFDYISAGIPVIVSDLPETGKIIREYDCGILLSKVTPGNLSEVFAVLKNRPEKLAQFRGNAGEASKSLNWEIESKKVIELYKRLLEKQHT